MGFQDILLDILALKRGVRFVDAPCTYSARACCIKTNLYFHPAEELLDMIKKSPTIKSIDIIKDC